MCMRIGMFQFCNNFGVICKNSIECKYGLGNTGCVIFLRRKALAFYFCYIFILFGLFFECNPNQELIFSFVFQASLMLRWVFAISFQIAPFKYRYKIEDRRSLIQRYG